MEVSENMCCYRQCFENSKFDLGLSLFLFKVFKMSKLCKFLRYRPVFLSRKIMSRTNFFRGSRGHPTEKNSATEYIAHRESEKIFFILKRLQCRVYF